jgi:acetylornithine deacetylase/succinyl-diaminopimelate desuccinylase-like protein
MPEDTARVAQDLIRLDTTNYGAGRSNGETEAAEYLGALLENLGLTTTYVDAAEHRTSVIARVPGSDPSLPALVVHGHTDVVPADPKNWSVDPFGGEIRDGMLWGRGAVDMKNMDAMVIGALTDILGADKQPRRDLVIAFFSDEENGGVFGSQYVVANNPELFEGATEAISEVGGYSVMLNGTRAYLLQTGEKALIWIKLVARGTAAHGSRVIHANAVTRLAEAVVALGRRDWPVHLTSTTEELVAELARIMETDITQSTPEEIVLSTGTAAGFIQASLRTTTNPTVLTAGYKHNVIPDVAEALIDIRCLAGEEESVLAEVRDLIGPHVELEIVHQDIGLENKFEGPLVEAMVGALQSADPGAPVLPYLLSGGTDNKALSKLGITGYGFAPLQLPAELDFPALFHGVDERVPLDALVFGRRVLGDLLTNY